MPKMIWDQIGERQYELGIEQVGLFKQVKGAYPMGVPWNGITALNITPSGAEETPLYANNAKYGSLTSNEEIGGTIEAYMYPEEWSECDGSKSVVPGMYISQQPRVPFGLVAKTLIGNDVDGNNAGYRLHIIYGAKAAPTENANTTVNDNPENKTMSWEFTTTPVQVPGFKPTAHIHFDSTKVDGEKLKALEDIIYGSEEVEPRLPLPEEVFTIMGYTANGEG